MWSAFIAWYKNQADGERCAVDREKKCEVTGGDSGDCSLHEDTGNRVNEKSLVQQAEECRLAISNKAGVQEAVEALHEEVTYKVTYASQRIYYDVKCKVEAICLLG